MDIVSSPMTAGGTVGLHCSRVRVDRPLRTTADVAVGVVGDFSVDIDGRLLYTEQEFPVAELMLALATWAAQVASAADGAPDFAFTSIESEDEGLLRFTRIGSGSWRVSAFHEHYQSEETIDTAGLIASVEHYAFELQRTLGRRLDLASFADNPAARKWLLARAQPA